jgi:tetratricopeptide (TPR) repeat protein
MTKKKTCFVIMGFGQKTDYESGRTLDLDRTYRLIIKPAAEEAGLECGRADEFVHSGVIDRPPFDHLFNADLVVADLSTKNANTLYELGVRHALRPNGTIVIAEDKFKFPFDISTMVIRPYQHLGTGIDYEEAMRMRAGLAKTMREMLARDIVDSPVYTFLEGVAPPQRISHVPTPSGLGAEPQRTTESETPAIAELMDAANQAMTEGNFADARAILLKVAAMRPGDPYVVQRLALATYKSKQPTGERALNEALKVLEPLAPRTTLDPETLGLYGAVHKRLWDMTQAREHLDESIRAYERGFFIKADSYNGINLAFMLNVRASVSLPTDAVADYVQAQRIRRQVIAICEAALSGTSKELPADDRFWLQATLAEAWLGVDDRQRSDDIQTRLEREAPARWMAESTREQLKRLEQLLADSPLRLVNDSRRQA